MSSSGCTSILKAWLALVLPYLFFVQTALVISYANGLASRSTDFRQLYSAAYMVRTGHATEIYNFERLKQFEDRLVGTTDYGLPFNHLAYETLFLIPLSYLPFRKAYLLWMALNVLFLVGLRSLLTRSSQLGTVWRLLPLAVFACFIPFGVCLALGQDSILLTTIFGSASLLVRQAKNVAAGLVLSAGLFKFQFVLPCVLLYALWKNWSLIKGFAIGAAGVLGISSVMVGIHGLVSYMHSLLAMSVEMTSAGAPAYGIYPVVMANIRGVFHTLFAGILADRSILFVTLAVSAGVFIWSARRRPSFRVAVPTAVLVSYHCFVHDLSILIVPILDAGKGEIKVAVLTFSSIGIFYSLGVPAWISAIPVAIFLLSCGENKKNSSDDGDLDLSRLLRRSPVRRLDAGVQPTNIH